MIVIAVKSFAIPVNHFLPKDNLVYSSVGENLASQRKALKNHAHKSADQRMSHPHYFGSFAENDGFYVCFLIFLWFFWFLHAMMFLCFAINFFP
jgi:hypothetical protein